MAAGELEQDPSRRSRARPRAAGSLALFATFIAGGARAADRDALLHIVQEQCVPHWQQRQDPAPCVGVMGRDFAVLKDRKGGAHYLLIATASIRGIEEPALLRQDAPNYFAAAWQARDRLAAAAGGPVADAAVGLAINSARARGQDQLHIHIECVSPRLRRLLQLNAAHITARWAPLQRSTLPFLARRMDSLDASSPFRLLAEEVPHARSRMGDYTIVVAQAPRGSGSGFILLAGRTGNGPAALFPLGDRVPPGETMLDSVCPATVPQVQLPSSPPEEPPPSSQPAPSLMPKSGPPRSGLGSGGG